MPILKWIPFVLGLPWTLVVWTLMVIVRVIGGRDLRFETHNDVLALSMTFRGWARAVYAKIRAGASTLGNAVVYRDEEARERKDLAVHEHAHVYQFELAYVLAAVLSLVILFVGWALAGRFLAGWRFAISAYYLTVVLTHAASYFVGFCHFGRLARYDAPFEQHAYNTQALAKRDEPIRPSDRRS